MNTTFQSVVDGELVGMNANGVPLTSILVNVSVTQAADPRLVSRSAFKTMNATDSFQIVGIDAESDRSGRKNFGFNYFRIGSEQGGGLSSSNRRRVMIINGTTGELLLNIQPGLANPDAENNAIIAAINMVQPAPEESFTTWISESTVPVSAQGGNDDPDGDGLSNLLEYALGLDPALADAENGPRIMDDGTGQRLVFQRSKSAVVDPIVIETGATLEDFSTYIPTTGDMEVTDQGETELLSVTLPPMGGKAFARLRVSAQ